MASSPPVSERWVGSDGEEMRINKTGHAAPSTKVIEDRIIHGIATPMLGLLPSDLKHCIAAGCDMVWGIEDGVLLVNPAGQVVIIRIEDRIFLYEHRPDEDVLRATTFQYKGE